MEELLKECLLELLKAKDLPDTAQDYLLDRYFTTGDGLRKLQDLAAKLLAKGVQLPAVQLPEPRLMDDWAISEELMSPGCIIHSQRYNTLKNELEARAQARRAGY